MSRAQALQSSEKSGALVIHFGFIPREGDHSLSLSSKVTFFEVREAISISLIIHWTPHAKSCAANFSFPCPSSLGGRRVWAFQILSGTSTAVFVGYMPLLTAFVHSLKCRSSRAVPIPIHFDVVHLGFGQVRVSRLVPGRS